MSGSFSPSQAAEQSGFSLDTLRYYERIGLLDGIDRAPSGHRRFRDDDLEWLGVLRCLRDTGMPIAQMRRYAELARGGQATLAERMNLLTGEYHAASQLPADDVRTAQPWVRYFDGGRPAPAWLARFDAVRQVLTSGGRTPVQGALCWLLARSPATIPIPGIRSVAQAEQNAAALRLGPLPAAQMDQIAALLGPGAAQPA